MIFWQIILSDTNKNNANTNNTFDIKLNINIMPLFDNCISIKYNNYYYNRIEHNNIKTLIEKETKQKFYFISPNNNESDNIILLISSNLNKEFIYKYISHQNNSNLSLNFIDIYNNITNVNDDKNNNSNNIQKFLYIPSFDINSKIRNFYKKHSKPENEDEFDENNNDIYVMNNYDEFFNVKFISEDFIGKYKNKKNKYKNSSINFYYDKIEDDYTNNKDCIIDDNFIIFILNFDVIDNFAAIPLISLYITKDNFISDI